jgi:hypothetical protein
MVQQKFPNILLIVGFIGVFVLFWLINFFKNNGGGLAGGLSYLEIIS